MWNRRTQSATIEAMREELNAGMRAAHMGDYPGVKKCIKKALALTEGK
jgi:hypothetical protein